MRIKSALIGVLLSLSLVSSAQIQPPKKPEVGHSTFSILKYFEGVRHKAYDDSFGNMTIGVGHLVKKSEIWLLHIVLTDKQVEELFKSDLKGCQDAVETVVIVPLTQGQFDALHSLCFNIGEDRFKASSVVGYLNQEDYQKAADAFYDYAKPSVLKRRRKIERALFLGA